MVKTASCATYKAIKGDVLKLGGFTVLVVSTSTSMGIGMTIRDSSGNIISGISDTQPGYAHTGQVYIYPDQTDPDFSVRIDERGYDMLGFVRIDYAVITLCYYSDVPPAPIGDGELPPPGSSPPVALPPPPVLGPEPPLNYSGFMQFIESVYNRIQWLFQFVFDSLAWIISALGGLIPRLLEFILYILSLQWIIDFISQFFARLDIWVSEKFGIDPALPFWDEIVKRAIGWLSAGIDEAAGKALERLK